MQPEPHRFSRATKGRFDSSDQRVSYPVWDRAKYRRTGAGRWFALVFAAIASFGEGSI
ncbi:hypothetical protein [Hydrocarboniphaga sp.]|uniref:hypothetical protein n=1 Tax=Hydrocarboniphaga sp. TaxID=2033016 RepID=UPI003D152CAA